VSNTQTRLVKFDFNSVIRSWSNIDTKYSSIFYVRSKLLAWVIFVYLHIFCSVNHTWFQIKFSVLLS